MEYHRQEISAAAVAFDQIFGVAATSNEDYDELVKRGDLQELIAVSLKRGESSKYSNIEEQMRKALSTQQNFAGESYNQIIDTSDRSPSVDEEDEQKYMDSCIDSQPIEETRSIASIPESSKETLRCGKVKTRFSKESLSRVPLNHNAMLNNENLQPYPKQQHSDGTYRLMGNESKSPRIEENDRQIFLQESIESFHINQVLGEIKNATNFQPINESYSPNNFKLKTLFDPQAANSQNRKSQQLTTLGKGVSLFVDNLDENMEKHVTSPPSQKMHPIQYVMVDENQMQSPNQKVTTQSNNFFFELNLGDMLDGKQHSREESGNFKFNMVPVPDGILQTPQSQRDQEQDCHINHDDEDHKNEMSSRNQQVGSLTSSATCTAEMLTRQLDKISSRKSSIAGYGPSPQLTNVRESNSYLNKLTSAYHQGMAIVKNRSQSRNNKDQKERKSSTSPLQKQLKNSNVNIQARQIEGKQVGRSKTPIKKQTIFPQKNPEIQQKPSETTQQQSRPRTGCKKLLSTSHLNTAFKDINLQIFVEFGRIKKPSRAALITGQLLFQYVKGMRIMFGMFENQQNNVQVATSDSNEFVEWSIVQQLVCSNVNRFQTEIIGYKAKLTTLAHFEKKTLHEVIPSILVQMRDLYFNDETSAQALLNLIADKNLKAIVVMIYQILANYLLVGVPRQHFFIKPSIVIEKERSRSKTPKKNVQKLNQTQTMRMSNHASPFSSFLNQTTQQVRHDRSHSNVSNQSPFASQNIKQENSKVDSTSNSPVPHFGRCTLKTPQSRSGSRSNSKIRGSNSSSTKPLNIIGQKNRPSVSPIIKQKKPKSSAYELLNDTFHPIDPVQQQQEDQGERDIEPNISPRQMRHAIHQGRAHIHELITEKMQEIETNLGLLQNEDENLRQRCLTPSGRKIDFNVINQLKQRRIEQKKIAEDLVEKQQQHI